MAETLLRIERAGVLPVAFPLRSRRGVQQGIQPYVSGGLVETVDGGHRDATVHRSRKFQTSVSCNDFHAPGFAGLWPGALVTIHWAIPLTQTLDAATATPTLIRDLAQDSVPWGVLPSGVLLKATSVAGRVATFSSPVEGVQFCPKTEMLVQDWDQGGNAWDALTDWSFSAIEKRGY
jgi:hypothetical protein